MHEFGIDIATTRSLPPHYLISGGQKYRGAEATVEGDWSQAAFWYAANCLGCTVDVRGVSQYSTQGDRVIESCCLELSQPGDTEIDMSGCPDLAPPVAAAAAVRQGVQGHADISLALQRGGGDDRRRPVQQGQGEGSVIHNLADSQDIRATRRCLAELTTNRRTTPELDCGESGSTLRFLIPIALALRGGGVFTGQGRLMERPQKPYFDLFDEKGIRYERKDNVLTVEGRLTPGEYRSARHRRVARMSWESARL